MKTGSMRLVTIFSWILILVPFVEMANGAVLEYSPSNNLPIGPLFASIVMTFTTLVVMKRSRNGFWIILSAIMASVITIAHSYYAFGTFPSSSLVWMIRIYYTLCIFLGVKLASSSQAGHQKIIRSLVHAGVVIGWSLLACKVFGIGQHTYSQGGVGFKGLYYGQNDLTAAMSIVFPLLLRHSLQVKSWISYINLLVFASSMLAIGTKTADGTIILMVIVLIVYWLTTKRVKVGLNLTLKILFPTAATLFIILLLFRRTLKNLYGFQVYFYEHSSNLLVYLTSGRSESVPYLLDVFVTHPWAVLFGTGFSRGNKLLQQAAGRPIILEFDPLSILLAGGVILVLVVCLVYLPVFQRIFSKRGIFINPWLSLSLFLGVFSSFFAGHVMESGIAGPIFSAIAAIFTTHQRQGLPSESGERSR